jgi:hypothetical protein
MNSTDDRFPGRRPIFGADVASRSRATSTNGPTTGIGGEFQYRIKSSHEGYERVAKESELVVQAAPRCRDKRSASRLVNFGQLL